MRGTPVVTALNKCDRLENMPDVMGSGTVLISAKTGYGLNRLLEAIAKALPPSQLRMRLLLPYDKAALALKSGKAAKFFQRSTRLMVFCWMRWLAQESAGSWKICRREAESRGLDLSGRKGSVAFFILWAFFDCLCRASCLIKKEIRLLFIKKMQSKVKL